MLSTANGKRRWHKRKVLLTFMVLLMVHTLHAQKLTLQFKNTPLEEAFRMVEKATAFRFSYANEGLVGTIPLNFSVNNEEAEAVIKKMFEGQPLAYVIDQHFVMVKPRPQLVNGEVRQTATRLFGTVKDERGEPVVGASVVVKHSGKGTTTNERGEFLLEEVTNDNVLAISSVGYTGTEVRVQLGAPVRIILAYGMNKLDETVVIAYGTTTQRLNTGSVSKLSAKEISKQPVSNPLAAMQGRASGVFVTQNNGLPGSNFRVQIRGQNSIQQGNEPFYVIDGVPYPSQSFSQIGGTNANSPLQLINPLLIQSIEVLKDADATAIYGSRGANGVILITTKNANTSKTTVEVNFLTGWSKSLYSMSLMNTNQYVRMRREAFSNDGVNPMPANAYDILQWDSTRYTDWKRLLIGAVARSHNFSSRISGGNALTRFSLGANYAKETTVFPADLGNQRQTIDLAVNHHSPDQRFNLSLTTSFGFDENTLVPGDLTGSVLLPPTMYAPYDANGKLVWRENGYGSGNPLAELQKRYSAKTKRLTARTLLRYAILPNLQVKTSVGYNSYTLDEETNTPMIAQDPNLNPRGSASFGQSLSESWIVEPTVEYNLSNIAKKGVLQVLAGFTLQDARSNNTRISGTGYTNDALLNTIAGAANFTATDGESLYRYMAGFARINFNWDGLYLINLTGRKDGSSRFAPSNRSALFGAVGMGWIVSKEQWFKKIPAVFSFAKLRGSYGITGNDQVGDYKYLDSYSGTTYPYGTSPGLRPTQLFNGDYGWEQIRKFELAFELGMLKDRILFNIARYQNRSDNQFIAITLPTQVGFSSVTQSFPGVVENKGLELDISAVLLEKSLQWKMNVNFTRSGNKLVSFPGLASSAFANRYAIGKPINASFGYQYIGIDPVTGIYQFEDMNKDGIVNTLDRAYVGTTDPSFFGGWGNSVTYKGWSLDVFVHFVKQKGQHPVYGSVTRPGTIFNMPAILEDRWRRPGDDAAYQKLSATAGRPAFTAAGLIFSSSQRLTDASYIRVRNLELAYALPVDWLAKIAASRGRLFLQAQNLLTFTSFPGTDPETQSSTSLPPLRTIALGLQIQF